MRIIPQVAFLSLLTAVACAQEATPAKAFPAINFQVLERQELDYGNRSIIYNRVVPPVLPKAPPAPPTPPARQMTTAELEKVRRWERKEFKMLFLSATVYDRQVTDLRWWEGGKQYRVFSNIDFNLVAGMGEFESADSVYMLLMGIGNESSKDIAEWNRSVEEENWPKELKRLMKTEVPSARAFPAGRSSYFIAPEDDFVAEWNRYVVAQGLPPEEMLAPQTPAISNAVSTGATDAQADTTKDPYAALDALHVFYDANRNRLADEYVKREAANAERARWLKEHPPIPKDTVINFWPKKSRVYLGN